MRNILIFGAQAFSGRLFELLAKDEPQNIFLGFVIDDEYYKADTLCGQKIYPYSTLKKNFSAAKVEILICIGYVNMNRTREEIFTRIRRDGWKIGNRCFFGNDCCTKNGIKIADDTLIGAGCYVSGNTQQGGIYVPPKMVKLDFDSSEIASFSTHGGRRQ